MPCSLYISRLSVRAVVLLENIPLDFKGKEPSRERTVREDMAGGVKQMTVELEVTGVRDRRVRGQSATE